MRKKAILSLSLLMILMFSSASLAQTAYIPAQNSKLWKDILTALKIKINEDGETTAIISTAHFKVKGNWAYLQGYPKKNATVEEYNHNVKALLKKWQGKWMVVKYLVGSNDLAALDWAQEFKAPKVIFYQ
jgi:hypothetical protein